MYPNLLNKTGPNDVLIKLNATGICFSDIHYMLNDLPIPKMSAFGVRSPGHEGAGTVVKLGSNVTNWKIGDRAGIKPAYDACFNCELCWTGRETYCDESPQIGLQFPGSYQQYVLSPARYTQRIPEGVDDFVAGPIMCSGSTIYCSLKESGLKPGDWAVFPGAGGGVGHMGVQLAKAMGMRVVGVDGGDDKKELCMKLGCEAFVDFTKVKDVAEEVIRICDGKGAHGVFVTATSASAYSTAPNMCRISGKVMCVGLRKSSMPLMVSITDEIPSSYWYCIRRCRSTSFRRQESARHRNKGRITNGYNKGARICCKSKTFSQPK